MRRFALRGIVIRVALKAARLRRFCPRVVTRSASSDPRQKQIGTLLARQRSRVAVRAVHKSVLRVIEIGVRHVTRSNV